MFLSLAGDMVFGHNKKIYLGGFYKDIGYGWNAWGDGGRNHRCSQGRLGSFSINGLDSDACICIRRRVSAEEPRNMRRPRRCCGKPVRQPH
jgi:hypothetical protein